MKTNIKPVGLRVTFDKNVSQKKRKQFINTLRTLAIGAGIGMKYANGK